MKKVNGLGGCTGGFSFILINVDWTARKGLDILSYSPSLTLPGTARCSAASHGWLYIQRTYTCATLNFTLGNF